MRLGDYVGITPMMNDELWESMFVVRLLRSLAVQSSEWVAASKIVRLVENPHMLSCA